MFNSIFLASLGRCEFSVRDLDISLQRRRRTMNLGHIQQTVGHIRHLLDRKASHGTLSIFSIPSKHPRRILMTSRPAKTTITVSACASVYPCFLRLRVHFFRCIFRCIYNSEEVQLIPAALSASASAREIKGLQIRDSVSESRQ